jgi:protein-S-isoprenylcysteine O-methyltransferase Ste14
VSEAAHAWALQLTLALASTPWLFSYWLAFRLAKRGTGSSVDVLYNLGFLLNLTWVAMVFAPQPRLPGLLEPMRLQGVALIPVLVGCGLAIGFTVANLRAMSLNGAAVRRRYAQPARLLCEGPYASIRHPMNTGGAFVFLGLCLTFGATYTALLFPLYVVLNHAFSIIEEREALRPAFAGAYEAYAARVPAYFAPRHWALLAIAALALLLQWALQRTC